MSSDTVKETYLSDHACKYGDRIKMNELDDFIGKFRKKTKSLVLQETHGQLSLSAYDLEDLFRIPTNRKHVLQIHLALLEYNFNYRDIWYN